MRAVLVLAAVLALTACGGDEEGRARRRAARRPLTGFTRRRLSRRRPSRLCARAAAAATALEQGDAGRLVELSYADTFVCDDLPADLFPDCSPGATLEGHAVTGADGKIGVLDAEDYEARLAELGDVTVAGVGTCGPGRPGPPLVPPCVLDGQPGRGRVAGARQARGGVVDRDRLRRLARELEDRLRRPGGRAGLRQRPALELDRIRQVKELPLEAEPLRQLSASARRPSVSVAYWPPATKWTPASLAACFVGSSASPVTKQS